jgi:large subunit ribosomal protein L17
MKKKVFGKKLSRASSTRKALFRSLLKALITYGSIKTTKAKAKAVVPDAENIITVAKTGNLNSRRRVSAILSDDREVVNKFYSSVLPALKDRKGGYTRIVNLPSRKGDGAQMARLEWTEIKKSEVKEAKTEKTGESKKAKIVKPKINLSLKGLRKNKT